MSHSPQLWDTPVLGQSGARWGIEQGCSTLLPGGPRGPQGATVPKGHSVPWGLLCLGHTYAKPRCKPCPANPPGEVALARVALAGEALTRAAVPGDPAKGRGDEHSPLPPQPSAKLMSCTHGHPNMLLRPLSRGFWDTEAASHTWCQLGHPARYAECSLRWAWGH